MKLNIKFRLFMGLMISCTSVLLNAQTCLPNGITITQQTQIDNFAKNNPGCTTILGDLRIGAGSDAVQNLDGLNGLVEVQGNLLMWTNTGLQNLNGLSNLKHIGGRLEISYNHSLTDLKGLERLDSVEGNVEIYSNFKLETLNGFQNVKKVGGVLAIGKVTAGGNKVLRDIKDLGGIQSIGGDIQIAFNDSLKTLDGLNLSGKVGGNLLISNNQSLQNLWAIENIAGIDGDLTITRNKRLRNLDDLSNLDTIVGYLNVTRMDSLQYLTKTHRFKSIGGIVFDRNPMLDDIEAIHGIKNLPLKLQLTSMSSLTTLESLDSLRSVGGDLVFSSNPRLKDFSELINLKQVGGAFFVSSNDSLRDLKGLESIDTLGGIVWIMGNKSLKSLEGLHNLVHVDGTFRVQNNDALTDLNHLSSFRTLKGMLAIQENQNLVSLSGLDSIESGSIAYLTLSGTSLSKCHVKSICTYLLGVRSYDISGITDCRNRASILDSCTSNLDVEQIARSMFRVYPNPCSTTLNIKLPSELPSGEVRLYSVDGTLHRRRSIESGEKTIQISTSELSAGVYQLQFIGTGVVQTSKVVVQ